VRGFCPALKKGVFVMRFTKKEALQQEFYYKLFDTENGDTICRSDNLNEIKRDAYDYDDCCDGDCYLRCVKLLVTVVDGKKKGVKTAEYNPYTKKLLYNY
jgi:hypothetical protein